MLARIVERSLTRRLRRKLLSVAAIALGITVATVAATIALNVGDQVSRELRSFGANITVLPAADGLPVSVGGVDYRPAGSGAFLNEADLVRIKGIFWRNNIVAFAPFLYVPVTANGRSTVLIGSWFNRRMKLSRLDVFTTGLRDLHPAWRITGAWPHDGGPECLVGERLARQLGAKPGLPLTLEGAASSPDSAAPSAAVLVVKGIVETGGPEDDQVIAPLAVAQRLSGEEGKVRRVEISALTKPEDNFARSDVTKMSPQEFERWSCSPYARTIAYQIEQAIPGSEAKPVYRVAQTEGRIVQRVGLLMWLLAGVALVAASLAVGSMMLASMLERRAEIGLFKSLGATDGRVASILLAEVSAIGIAGGAIGYFAGSILARLLARSVFGFAAGVEWPMLPAAVALALVVAWAGSATPLARGLGVPATVALRNQ